MKKPSLLDNNPILCAEWSNQNELGPANYSPKSSKKVWWTCKKCCYEWKSTILARANGSGCPSCKGKVPSDKNRLSTIKPEIAKEWDYSKNLDSPKDVTFNSDKKRWWICPKCNKSYLTYIKSRTAGHGCIKCGHKHVAKCNSTAKQGQSLADKFPELIKEWSNKNQYGPERYKCASNKKVIWLCVNCNQEWETKIRTRATGRMSGCPKCKQSNGERDIENYLKQNNIIHIREFKFKDCRYKRPLPFDFALFNKDKLLGLIEFHGEQHYNIRKQGYFSTQSKIDYIQNNDTIKDNFCKQNNIRLLIIPYWEKANLSQILDCFIKTLNEP